MVMPIKVTGSSKDDITSALKVKEVPSYMALENASRAELEQPAYGFEEARKNCGRL